jgi:hypothetical protein
VTYHNWRHFSATHQFEVGSQINLIQELLGHKDFATTIRTLTPPAMARFTGLAHIPTVRKPAMCRPAPPTIPIAAGATSTFRRHLATRAGRRPAIDATLRQPLWQNGLTLESPRCRAFRSWCHRQHAPRCCTNT